jgi:hypothetical protein
VAESRTERSRLQEKQRIMGSKYHPKLYDTETVATLKDAFYDIWERVERQDAVRISRSDEDDIRAAIIQTLLDVVAEGTTSRVIRAERCRSDSVHSMPRKGKE